MIIVKKERCRALFFRKQIKEFLGLRRKYFRSHGGMYKV